MLDPESIIARAKSGAIPADWRVLRPKGTFPLQAGFAGSIYTVAALVFVVIISFILHDTIGFSVGSAGGSEFGSNPLATIYPLSTVAMVTIAISTIVVVGLLSFFSAAASVPSSYFVFIPEGAVQTTSTRAITAIDYAQLDMINPRVNITRTVENTPVGTPSAPMIRQTTTTRISVSIELHYLNGRTINWRPAGRFGSAESICQRLINGLQEYKMRAGPYR